MLAAALYPDCRRPQVLMASTYPLEIVQADRWVKATQGPQGRRAGHGAREGRLGRRA